MHLPILTGAKAVDKRDCANVPVTGMLDPAYLTTRSGLISMIQSIGSPVAEMLANRVQPLKRPRSSMAPTLVLNAKTGDLEGITGSPGGSGIIQYTTKSIIGMIDWNLNVQQAINLPNFGTQTNATSSIEKGSVIDTAALRNELTARGHTVVQSTAFTSGLHGITFNGLRSDGTPGLLARNPGAGVYGGGADPRLAFQPLR